MRSHGFSISACLIVLGLSVIPLSAQRPSGGSGGSAPTSPGTPSVPSSPRVPMPNVPAPRDSTSPSSVFLSGRVVLDQGVAPPESVVVEQVCGNTVRARTHTDLRGSFSIGLGQAALAEPFANGDASEERDPRSRPTVQLTGCDLRAVLAGYISSELHLDGTGSDIGIKNVGTIVLRPLGGTQSGGGGSISVTSFQVPDKARKEYEKALKFSESNDRKRAQEHLLKAVEIYPKYAVAWVTLGELHQQSDNLDDAKAAFERAQQADPNYVSPYLHLAYFAAKDKKWEDVFHLSEQAIRLDPVDYPDSYFLNAVANYNLHHLPEARRSALKAAEMDKLNHIPRIHYLLAAIYEASGERESAVAQLNEYLKLEPNTPESASARQRLDKLNRQSERVATN